ncbi:uncharacterized protein LOC105354260 [Oryzias latipes]
MDGSPQQTLVNKQLQAPSNQSLDVQVHLKDPNPEDHNGRRGQMSSQCLVQDLDQEEQIQDSVDRGSNLNSCATNQREAEESGGGFPALVVTEPEESLGAAPAAAAASRKTHRPADLVISSTSFGCDGADMNCFDLLSPRSDSFSVTSDSRRSEDDTSSVAASSVMSLFHRVQLDPLEKDWLRSSALGNTAAQRLLLTQEPSLILKKDFISVSNTACSTFTLVLIGWRQCLASVCERVCDCKALRAFGECRKSLFKYTTLTIHTDV